MCAPLRLILFTRGLSVRAHQGIGCNCSIISSGLVEAPASGTGWEELEVCAAGSDKLETCTAGSDAASSRGQFSFPSVGLEFEDVFDDVESSTTIGAFVVSAGRNI